MKKEAQYLAIFAVLALGIVAIYYGGQGGFTGYAVFDENSATGFNGEMQNVVYDSNLSAVVLEANQTNGTYTSGVFGDGNESLWNNLTFNGNNLSFEVRSCSLEDCSDSSFSSKNLSDLDLTGKYFQYRTTFNSVSSNLTSVSLDYTVLFSVTILSPLDGEEYGSEEVELSVSANEDVDSQWYVLNGGNQTFFEGALNLNLTAGTDYNLTVYANNSEGEEVNSSVSFSVSDIITVWTFEDNDCTERQIFEVNKGSDDYTDEDDCEDEISSEDSDSETSGSEVTPTSSTEPSPYKAEFSSEEFSQVSLAPGSSQDFSWLISNEGNGPSSGCLFVSSGDFASWVVSSGEPQNINAGDQGEFMFTVNVPGEAELGEYNLGVEVQCSQSEVSNFHKDLLVVVGFPESEQNDESLESSRSGLTGFSVFEGMGTGGYAILVVAVLALASVIFVSRKMRKEGKTLKDIFKSFSSSLKRDEKSESSE